MESENRIGLILAGGRSSRMGQEKAHLVYRGRALLDHMAEILRHVGIKRIYVAGQGFAEYACLPDLEPGAGPAPAVRNALERIPDARGFLIIPVDMPLLTPALLETLMKIKGGAYFSGYPLPAWIPMDRRYLLPEGRLNNITIRSLLTQLEIKETSLPSGSEPCMANINTLEDWMQIQGDV